MTEWVVLGRCKAAQVLLATTNCKTVLKVTKKIYNGIRSVRSFFFFFFFFFLEGWSLRNRVSQCACYLH